MMSRLREVHPELGIRFLEEEFGDPTGGRPNVEAEREAPKGSGGWGNSKCRSLVSSFFFIVTALALSNFVMKSFS